MRSNASLLEIADALYKKNIDPQKRRSILGEIKAGKQWDGVYNCLAHIGIGRVRLESSACSCCEGSKYFSLD